MVKKIRFPFILFGAIIISVILLFALQKTKPQKPGPETPQQPVFPLEKVSPLPTSLVNNQKNVQFYVPASTLSVPASLLVYSAADWNVTSQKDAVAQRLGFSGPGFILPTVIGGYRWSSGTSVLKMLINPPSLSLSNTEKTTGALPSREEALLIGEGLLNKSGVSETTVSLVPGAVEYATLEDEATTAAILTYSYQVNGFPMYLPGGAQMRGSVRVVSGGVIGAAELPLPPSLSSLGEKTTISVGAATELLQNNKGSFVGVGGDGSDNYITDPSFGVVNVTNVSLGYLLVRTQNVLRPIYVFTGSAVDGAGASARTSVVYFVPATN